MNKKIIANWFADLYDQLETDVDDINFLKEIIGPEPKNILEVSCGSGRILVELAKVNHQVEGFDIEEAMLKRIASKVVNLNNIKYYLKDAISDDWGNSFDVVVLAANILLNIESNLEYQEAQKLLIKKAYDCLKDGGYIYLDFNYFTEPTRVYKTVDGKRVIFKGTDQDGVTGYYALLSSKYDQKTRMLTGKRFTELEANNEVIIQESDYQKYIPTLEEVLGWFKETGFSIEEIYGGYKREPIDNDSERAIIYAKK